MNFTGIEWDILSHRLEACDAVAEALCDDEDSAFGFDEVEDRCRELLDAGPTGVDTTDALTRAIIVDCCEGATMFTDMEDAVAVGQITRGKMLAYFRAARSLEDKVGTFVNR